MHCLGGVLPYDGTVRYVQDTVKLPVTVACSVQATVGIILAGICIIFNYIFRKRKQVVVIDFKQYLLTHIYDRICENRSNSRRT